MTVGDRVQLEHVLYTFQANNVM